MAGELSKHLRHAAPGKIGRAATDHPADRADPAGDEAAVGQFADPHGEIDMLFQEVDHPVGQHDPDVDLRVGL